MEYYDIFEIQDTLKELNTLEFEKFSINDKYELYKKIIKLYKYFYNDVIDTKKYAEEEDIGYFEIILDIINNIKIILKKLQNMDGVASLTGHRPRLQIEQVVIELMKPERVLNRLMTYEDYEYF